jgi:hypothetical protein
MTQIESPSFVRNCLRLFAGIKTCSVTWSLPFVFRDRGFETQHEVQYRDASTIDPEPVTSKLCVPTSSSHVEPSDIKVLSLLAQRKNGRETQRRGDSAAVIICAHD